MKIVLLLIFFITRLVLSQTVYKLDVDRFTHYNPEDWVSYLPALQVNAVEMDDYYIYFGTNGGILRYHKVHDYWDEPFTTSTGLGSNLIKKIIYDPKNSRLYAETASGAFDYRQTDGYWKRTDKNLPPIPIVKDIENSQIKNLHFPPYSRPSNEILPLFFMHGSYDFQRPDIISDPHFREFKLTDRLTDDYQRVWFGTSGLGPAVADLFSHGLEVVPQSMANISLRDVEFTENQLWVGGIGKNSGIAGISAWDFEEDKWVLYEAPLIIGLYNDNVNVIRNASRYVLFGTESGVTLFDKFKARWKSLGINDGLNDEFIRDIKVYKNTAFIASDYGLNSLNLENLRIANVHGDVLNRSVVNQMDLSRDTLWIAARYGLYSLNVESGELEHHPSSAAMPDYNPHAVEKAGNRVWLAGEYGIYYLDISRMQWKSFPHLSFKSNFRDILSTKDAVWFATANGLLKYSFNTNYWRLFTTEDGLASNDLYNLDLDENYLWVSTSAGITKFLFNSKDRID